MKFPKIPKKLEWIVLGLAVIAVVANPGAFKKSETTEGLLKKIAIALGVLGVYYLMGPTYGLAVGAIAGIYLWTQSKEGLEVEGKAIEGTQCPAKFEFDVGAQMCKNKDTGALVKPTQVVCASGFKPNDTNDKCIQEPPAEAPEPPKPSKPEDVAPPAGSTGSKTTESAAPAKGTEKFEGKGTVATTPGEAQMQAQQTVVLQKQENEPETFTNWTGAGYPLQ